MKTLLTTALMSFLLLTSRGQTVTGSSYVGAQANIFGAYDARYGEWWNNIPPAPGGGGAGAWPSGFTTSGTLTEITFASVVGAVSLTPSLGILNGADGNISFPTDISPHGGLSGIRSDASGFLVGVFLDANEPQDPTPPTLDFSASGLGTRLLSLTPEIGQLFFIGDGLTGTGSGEVQRFIPPPTATSLSFGFADAPNYTGLTGQYQDNVGHLDVTFTYHIVPEPTAWTLCWLGGVALGLTHRRRHHVPRAPTLT